MGGGRSDGKKKAEEEVISTQPLSLLGHEGFYLWATCHSSALVVMSGWTQSGKNSGKFP